MFKVSQAAQFMWPVTVNVPQDGGRFVKATFDAQFESLPQSEIDRIIHDAQNGDQDASVAARCLVGWKGVQDSDGSELVFSEAAKERLLEIPYFRGAVLAAFFESINGGGRRKN